MSRALSLLAAFASPVFVCAAVAGWLFEVWPANPLTFGVSGLLVVGGPILGIVHVATAKGYDDEEEAEEAVEEETVVMTAPVLVRRPVPAIPGHAVMTPKAAAAARFVAWRDTPNPAIELRERERRASRYIRS
jgi:hypothetical protein